MLTTIKNNILKNYIDFRLKWFKQDNSIIIFPMVLKNVKNILIIIPADYPEENVEIRTFILGLYKIFRHVKVSTFERSSFRPEDGNWFGLPNENYLENFHRNIFDNHKHYQNFQGSF